MLRIVSEQSGNEATLHLRLEGRVMGPWVDELRRACERALGGRRRVVLDLRDVSFIDRDGIALFRALTERPITVVNCSPFVTEQLREVSPWQSSAG